MSSSPTPTNQRPRCSECGHRAGDPVRLTAQPLFHWHRVVPVATMVIAIAVLAVWLYTDQRDAIVGSGSMHPRVVKPALTLEDVRAIAEGEYPGFSLAEAVRDAAAGTYSDVMPGTPALDVGFVEPRETLIVTRTRGWPVPWFTRREHHNYDDPVRREGFRPAVTDAGAALPGPHARPRDPLRIPPRPRIEWLNWNIRFNPPPESTGGIERRTSVNLPGIAIALGLVILAWWIAAGIVFARNALRARYTRSSGTRFKLGTAAVIALLVLMAGIINSETTERESVRVTFDRLNPGTTGPSGQMTVLRGFVQPDLTPDELDVLAARSDGDAALARRILDALENPPDRPEQTPRYVRNEEGHLVKEPPPAELVLEDVYLAAVFQHETVVENGRLTIWSATLPLVRYKEQQFLRRDDFGPRELVAPPPGARVTKIGSSLSLLRSDGDPETPATMLSVNLEQAGLVLVGLALIWMIALGTCRLIHGLIMGRRGRTGRCAACGYQIHVPKEAR